MNLVAPGGEGRPTSDATDDIVGALRRDLRAFTKNSAKGHLVPVEPPESEKGEVDPPYWGEAGGPSAEYESGWQTLRQLGASFQNGVGRVVHSVVSLASVHAPTHSVQEYAVAEITESIEEAAQPQGAAQSEGKDWTADQKWWQEAMVATQGTRARFFLSFRRQSDLSESEAWELATQQAYDDLRQRCPDGSIVPSDHPWDREYTRQVNKVMAARDAALSAQQQAHASAVERLHAELDVMRTRSAEYLEHTMGATGPQEAVLAFFGYWEQSIRDASTEHAASYQARLALNEHEYSGDAIFARAIEATNRRIKPDAEHADLVIHQWRLDRDEEWESSPYHADFERAIHGLARALRSIRGGGQPRREVRPLAEFYWDQLVSVSAALIEQGYDGSAAYRLAQNAAVKRALTMYDRAQVANLPGVEEYLR